MTQEARAPQRQRESSLINHVLRKLYCLSYIFVTDSMGLASVNLTQLAPKPAVSCEVTYIFV